MRLIRQLPFRHGGIVVFSIVLALLPLSLCATDGAKANEVTFARPLTIEIPISPETRAALDRTARNGAHVRTSVKLFLKFAPPTKANSPSIRIFLGKADATDETPTSDPHYLGSVSIYPSPAPPGASKEAYSYDLDVRNLVARVTQISSRKFVTATFVALRPRPGTEPGTIELCSAALVPADPPPNK